MRKGQNTPGDQNRKLQIYKHNWFVMKLMILRVETVATDVESSDQWVFYERHEVPIANSNQYVSNVITIMLKNICHFGCRISFCRFSTNSETPPPGVLGHNNVFLQTPGHSRLKIGHLADGYLINFGLICFLDGP